LTIANFFLSHIAIDIVLGNDKRRYLAIIKTILLMKMGEDLGMPSISYWTIGMLLFLVVILNFNMEISLF
jgi:hypothetical protein